MALIIGQPGIQPVPYWCISSLFTQKIISRPKHKIMSHEVLAEFCIISAALSCNITIESLCSD